ncbi:hypothetical protein VNO77_12313 [Canavalia gladiata]|uniref:ATP-dependent Clp protease proteolytic subunit n=1 Tax=Canavalia gladiata TaxID=3824 RepID=A0AAN9QR12_CANGL
MSSSLSLSLSAPSIHDSAPHPSFLNGTKLFLFPHRVAEAQRRFSSFSVKCSFNRIPKQFRQENLKDGLMDNYKNAPKLLYGLTPNQMDMFMTEYSPIRRQSERVTEESLSAANCYKDLGGILNTKGRGGRSNFSTSVSRYQGGGGGRPRQAPPDLPSLLLDSRIVYLGMPIYSAVTELIVAQFMWLDYDNPTKPIYLYINSPGTQNEKNEIIAPEGEAFSIADTLCQVKSDVYTVNMGMAYGQAAMLLALGKKGYRAVQESSCTKLYLPKMNRTSGDVTDMWIRAKELEANTGYFLELLAKGIGKSEEELARDIKRGPNFFQAEDAIEYGIADKIMETLYATKAPSRKLNDDDDEERPQSKAERMRRLSGGNPQVPPSGLRLPRKM